MILGSFSLASVIMPYYGPTHQSFLVLSTLSSKSRKKLDDYYPEFRRLMAKFWAEIQISSLPDGKQFPPFDMFKLDFRSSSK